MGLLLAAAAVKLLLPVKPSSVETVQASREIVVYVTGAVAQPGLYHLPLDSRLHALLQKAVLAANVDRDASNPAQKLKDGQKIVIPAKATDIGQNSDTASDSGNLQTAVVKAVNASGKVNINTAGLAELDAIPGIGPALAQRIIDYREQNGLFSSPDEIQNVSGIGPKTYEKMAGAITVGP